MTLVCMHLPCRQLCARDVQAVTSTWHAVAQDETVQANDNGTVCAGCDETPELEAKTIGKMGLKGTPGLRVMGREAAAARAEQKGGKRPGPGVPTCSSAHGMGVASCVCIS